MKILVVEDDEVFASLITGTLKKWGHDPIVAVTGKSAVGTFQNQSFDLILLDIVLPDAMGHTLIPDFRKVNADIGIITMTGYNTRELELETRNSRVLHYLIKPFSMQSLKDILDHISQKFLDKTRRGTQGQPDTTLP